MHTHTTTQIRTHIIYGYSHLFEFDLGTNSADDDSFLYWTVFGPILPNILLCFLCNTSRNPFNPSYNTAITKMAMKVPTIAVEKQEYILTIVLPRVYNELNKVLARKVLIWVLKLTPQYLASYYMNTFITPTTV